LWFTAFEPLKDREVYAVAFDPSDFSIIYAATDSGIQKSTNQGIDWQVVAKSFKKGTSRQTNALLVSPKKSEVLYVGTSEGIYRIDLKNPDDSLDVELDGKINSFVACSYADSFAVLAATETKGVFWSTDRRSQWLPINRGIKQPFPPILSLTLDHATSSTCYATLKNGAVLSHKFTGLRVGIFEPYSPTSSASAILPAEARQISARLMQRLSAPDLLELVRIDSTLDVASANRDSLISYGRRKKFDKLIGIDTSVEPGEEKGSQNIELKLYVFDMAAGTNKSYPQKRNFDLHYPGLVDEPARRIKEEEFGIKDEEFSRKQMWMKRYFWNGHRKFVLGGAAALGILAIIFRPEDDIVLPFPPPFPDQY
jgi:hypothetical protein